MKKQIFLIILALSSFSLSAQWLQQNISTNANLNGVFFVDNDNGWVVGSDGVILHTSDGGETWYPQSSGTDMTLESVYFMDQDHGCIAGGSWNYNIILLTQDGGYNWEIVYIDAGRPLTDIFFSDTTNGWAVGNSNYLYYVPLLHTNDGGETWESQSNSSGYGIHFTDSLTGWMVGGGRNGSTGYPSGGIVHTTDGGSSWTEQISGNGSDNFGILYSVFFSDQFNGWAAGGNECGWPPGNFSNILHTTDGGVTWEFQASPDEQCLYEIFFTDLMNGWAVGSCEMIGMNTIIHTSDGGENWCQQFCETNNILNSVYFINPENGWIVGDDGTLLHTENGGLTGLEHYHPAPRLSKLQLLNYPNPCSGLVTFEYELNENVMVTLKIFNHLGQGVDLLVNEEQTKGIIKEKWDAGGLLPGVYLVRLQAGDKIAVAKMCKQ